VGFLSRTRSSQSRGSTDLRLFFATDVHGSERCFRKFLNAGKFYDVQHLILGGDITGKVLIPIVRTPRGWSAHYQDHEYIDVSDAERAELETRIRDNGQYPVAGERDELEALADEGHRDAAFTRVVVESIERWVTIAEDRLRGTGIRCYITPGNDDFWEIDAPLSGSDVVEFVEGRCVRLSDGHEMITTGYSNITPWESPRELDEPALRVRIESMFASVEDPPNLVAVLHPPPWGTDLDRAPELTADMTVKMEGNEPKLASVGSTAVREFIEQHQPLLGLHGHVHESKAANQLGSTLCLNPGSEYTQGTLCGALVALGDRTVVSHQFVVG
jgi:Icc-related predicted phosphoesterase